MFLRELSGYRMKNDCKEANVETNCVMKIWQQFR